MINKRVDQAAESVKIGDYDPIKETESQIERMRQVAHRSITIETSIASLEHRLRDLKARS